MRRFRLRYADPLAWPTFAQRREQGVRLFSDSPNMHSFATMGRRQEAEERHWGLRDPLAARNFRSAPPHVVSPCMLINFSRGVHGGICPVAVTEIAGNPPNIAMMVVGSGPTSPRSLPREQHLGRRFIVSGWVVDDGYDNFPKLPGEGERRGVIRHRA